MLWHNENQQPFSWLGIDWGARGGITARELALWTTLQREYRARGLLPGEALSRFDAIGVQWDSLQASGAAARGGGRRAGGGGRATLRCLLCKPRTFIVPAPGAGAVLRPARPSPESAGLGDAERQQSGPGGGG